MAERIAKYNLDERKHEIADARRRMHPAFTSVEEEYQEWANEIRELYIGEGLIKLENRTEKFKALKFPEPRHHIEELEQLKSWYATQLMIHRDTAKPMVDKIFRTPELHLMRRSTDVNVMFENNR